MSDTVEVGRCKDCKYWRKEAEREDSAWCECVRMRTKHGEPVDEDSKAYAFDTSQWNAYGDTYQDFGCVMFEAKE